MSVSPRCKTKKMEKEVTLRLSGPDNTGGKNLFW